MAIPLTVRHQLRLITFDVNNGAISDCFMLLLALQYLQQNLESAAEIEMDEVSQWMQKQL
jgi:hypothetical protein